MRRRLRLMASPSLPLRGPRRVLALLLLALLAAAQVPPRAGADTQAGPVPAPDEVQVPDLALRTLPETARTLAAAGLVLERIYEARYSQGYELGLVVQQKPRPGLPVPRGSGVRVMVSAAQAGLPEGRAPTPQDLGLPAPAPQLPPEAPAAPAAPQPLPASADPIALQPASPPSSAPARAPFPLPPPMPVAPPVPEPVLPDEPLPGPQAAPEPVRAPLPVVPGQPPPPVVTQRTPPTPPPAPVAEVPVPASPPQVPPPHPGSPDAPALAERAAAGVVPDLLGLSLVDAEQRAREAGLSLYVERVPGHPVGRVLEQLPASGSARAAGSVVRVQVTAGGDLPSGARVPIPTVEVPRVTVPDLLDRTPPQAARILQDLGLSLRVEEVERGLPGRVADQRPGAGSEVPKGTLVTVTVPRGTAAPREAPVGPAAPAPGAQPLLPPTARTPGTAPEAPAAPAPPVAPAAPTQLGVPASIAPSEGTALPRQRTLALGFAWQPVDGADAYLLEVEERGPAGWLPNVRKTSRSSATTVELERVAPEAGELRWRVRALAAGREGQPCAWVLLR